MLSFATDPLVPVRGPMPPLLAITLGQAARKGLLPRGFTAPEPAPEDPDPLRLSQVLDRETLFRVAYVPFVIAELAWDYADTVILLAADLRLYKARPLARKIRALRLEYDRWRAPLIDGAHHRSELDNMTVYEDGVADTAALFVTALRADLRAQYPDLDPEHINLLVAVYQCTTLLRGLFTYAERLRDKLTRILRRRIADILPSHIRALETLVAAYVGDKPVSPAFRPALDRFADTFAAKMGSVDLNGL